MSSSSSFFSGSNPTPTEYQTAVNLVAQATQQANTALAAQTAAAASAQSAQGYSVSAGDSATTATNQASSAATSAAGSASSASNASTSATNAATSATAASNSATSAATSATNSANSATAAATSATNAATSATNAANSATAAATSEANAATTLASALTKSDNLASLTNAATARSNLGLATVASTGAYSDLSGRPALVASATTDTTNASNITSGTLSNSRLSGVVLTSNNLSDLASASTARTNLGLATVAATGAYSDLSGLPSLVASATTDTTNASNITSGTLSNSRLSGVALTANNLSDLASASSARTNLGLSTLATTTPGTGVATALEVNVGSAGAFVTNGGALGTPSSATLTNATGLPLATGVTGTLPVANGGTGVTTSTGSGANVLGTTPTFTTSALFPAGTVGAPGISVSGDTNTGIYFPAADTIGFVEGGVEAMRLDANGNLGLGVTPSAWSLGGAGYRAIEIGALGSALFFGPNDVNISSNGYFNSGWKYGATNVASRYQQTNGTHVWSTAPSGTAGSAISFTQAMTLDASGNLLVGTTTASGTLTVRGTSSIATATFLSGASGSLTSVNIGRTAREYTLGTVAGTNQFFSGTAAGDSVIAYGTGKLWIGTGNIDVPGSTTMVLDASGNVGIGTSSPQRQLDVNGSIRFSSGAVIECGSTAVNTYIAAISGASGYWAFGTNGSERARIDSSGNLLVGTTSSLGKVTISSAASSSALMITGSYQNGFQLKSYSGGNGFIIGRSISSDDVNNFFIYDAANTATRLLISSNGYFNCPGVYNNSAAASNAVNVTPSGDIYRSTSSRKYKQDIQDALFGLSDVMKLRPITYISKNTEISGNRRFGGLIAEEVDEAGLGVFVEYAPDGSPDNIHYGNMVSLAFAAIKELAAKVSALEAKQ